MVDGHHVVRPHDALNVFSSSLSYDNSVPLLVFRNECQQDTKERSVVVLGRRGSLFCLPFSSVSLLLLKLMHVVNDKNYRDCNLTNSAICEKYSSALECVREALLLIHANIGSTKVFLHVCAGPVRGD